ncbi:MAG: hypothetical protein ACUVUE_04365, partial [Candidatus Bathycorpusculaceae bacterium]
MGLAFLDENMRLSKKSVLGIIVLLLAGIAVVGWLLLNQQPQRGFEIYLPEGNKLVISDEDIVSYNKTSHEIKLNEHGLRRTKALDLYQKPFIVKLNGEEVYKGAFWSHISSQSYSGIVIVDVVLIKNGMTDSITIEKGYPSPDFFEGIDPRN